MARQLIFTSAPRGLVSGRSGFCTVARHRDLDEALVGRLERWSAYDRIQFAPGSQPVLSSHRILDCGGERLHILTRIVDAGIDYTGRTNHLAHHLIAREAEIESAPAPSLILLNWAGWRSAWKDAARFLTEEDEIDLAALDFQARESFDWCSLKPLVEDGQPVSGWFDYPVGMEREWLQGLTCASLALDGSPWEVTWTSLLQSQDEEAFVWRGANASGWAFRPDPQRVLATRSESLPTRAQSEGVGVHLSSGRAGAPKKASPWLPIAGGTVVALGALGYGWDVWQRHAERQRLGNEIRRFILEGNRSALEDRVRSWDRRGSSTDPTLREIQKEARLWLEAAQWEDRLGRARIAQDQDTVIALLNSLETLPEGPALRRMRPALTRSMEEAKAWLSDRKSASMDLQAAITTLNRWAQNGFQHVNEADVTQLLGRVKVGVAALGGSDAARLGPMVENIDASWKTFQAKKAAPTPARSQATRTPKSVETDSILSVVRPDGTVFWSGQALSAKVMTALWADATPPTKMSVGRLTKNGTPGRAPACEISRSPDSIKLYDGMNLLLEIRRTEIQGATGLQWRAASELATAESPGWWFRAEGVAGESGLEIRFLQPSASSEPAVPQLDLANLSMDGEAGRIRLDLKKETFNVMLPSFFNLSGVLEVKVRRGDRIVPLISPPQKASEEEWWTRLAVPVQPRDDYVEGALTVFDPDDPNLRWELIRFGGGS